MVSRVSLCIIVAAALLGIAACDDSLLVRNPPGDTCDGPRAASDDAESPLYTYTVISEYPHDAAAYTQGLIWVDTVLVEGTGQHRTPTTLRRVELETGNVIQMREPPLPAFGEGVTQVGDRIVQLTWARNIAFVYDAETFDSIGVFTYPTEGWGLTHDGTRFIMSDGTDTLYYRDLETFEEIGRVAVTDESGPVPRLNELEYIDGEVWANVYLTDLIVIIDPATGAVTGTVDLSGLKPVGSGGVLNGIAYDEENCRLFVTGKLWTRLFEIELVPIAASRE